MATEDLIPPIDIILPLMISSALESGVAGYTAADEELVDGERKLSEGELRPLIAAAVYIGCFIVAIDRNIEWERVESAFDKSLETFDQLSADEKALAKALVNLQFRSRIISEEPLDQQLIEKWWPRYQNTNCRFDSSFAHIVIHGLNTGAAIARTRVVDAQ